MIVGLHFLRSHFQYLECKMRNISRLRISFFALFQGFRRIFSKYSCRRMTIIGGLIAAAGGLLSSFAFSIWHFLLSFAVITGIGLSFCFNSAIVAVTYYFQVLFFFVGYSSLVLFLTVSSASIVTNDILLIHFF